MGITLQTEVSTKPGEVDYRVNDCGPNNLRETGLAQVQGQDEDSAKETSNPDEDEGCARHIPPSR